MKIEALEMLSAVVNKVNGGRRYPATIASFIAALDHIMNDVSDYGSVQHICDDEYDDDFKYVILTEFRMKRAEVEEFILSVIDAVVEYKNHKAGESDADGEEEKTPPTDDLYVTDVHVVHRAYGYPPKIYKFNRPITDDEIRLWGQREGLTPFVCPCGSWHRHADDAVWVDESTD